MQRWLWQPKVFLNCRPTKIKKSSLPILHRRRAQSKEITIFTSNSLQFLSMQSESIRKRISPGCPKTHTHWASREKDRSFVYVIESVSNFRRRSEDPLANGLRVLWCYVNLPFVRKSFVDDFRFVWGPDIFEMTILIRKQKPKTNYTQFETVVFVAPCYCKRKESHIADEPGDNGQERKKWFGLSNVYIVTHSWSIALRSK